MEKKEKDSESVEKPHSDSAELFDSLFKEDFQKLENGEQPPEENNQHLSQSDELLVSAFKEAVGTEESALTKKKGGAARTSPPATPISSVIPEKKSVASQEMRSTHKKAEVAEGKPGLRTKQTPTKKTSSPPRRPWKVILTILALIALAGLLMYYLGVMDKLKSPDAPRQVESPPVKPKVPEKGPLPTPTDRQVDKKAAPIQAMPPVMAEIKTKDSGSVPETTSERPISAGSPSTLPGATPKTGTPPTQEGTGKSQKATSYPYSIYLGSFRDQEQLEKALAAYRNMGLSPYWFRFDLGDKGIWFRVFAGYFSTREDADRFIKEKGITDAASRNTMYAALVGTYSSQDTLNSNLSHLKALGFSPYVIERDEGVFRLYVGAFYQKAHADTQVAELASRGIRSQVSER
jgi:cell division septation protein DedD